MYILYFLQGDPFQPVPAYEGFIVDSGHYANNSADGSSFIAAPGKIAKTDAVVTPASENLQPTLDECSRSCASTAGCTAFLYCKSGNGSCQGRTNVYPELGCELILQAESNANMTLPFMAIEQETTADLISGKILLVYLIPEYEIKCCIFKTYNINY